MNNEIKIKIDDKVYSVFLQNGFYIQKALMSPLHKHYHTEIQFILDGDLSVCTLTNRFNLKSGSAIAIPANTIHYSENIAKGTKMSAFLINKKIEKEKLINFSNELVRTFFNEIELSLKTNNHSKVISFINLFCSYFFESNPKFESNKNYAIVIEDFFTMKYSTNAKLTDLANLLNVSEKQAARLVLKYTGNNFTDEITKRRMEIAEILLGLNTLTKKEISEYVGYNSYSGFYKAYEKYRQEKNGD